MSELFQHLSQQQADLWVNAPFVVETGVNAFAPYCSKYQFLQDFKGTPSSIVLFPPRNRLQQQSWLADCTRLLPPYGILITAQENRAGAKSLQKDVEAVFESVQVESKYKGRIITATGPIQQDAQPLLHYVETIHAWSAPGLFAWDRLDKGSALLLDHMPDLYGDVADFGCGWGALSRAILKQNAVETLTAIDADALAIAAIDKNITDPRFTSQWRDATESINKTFDAILMNPPFHEGGKADRHDLGAAMIDNAMAHLKPGGRLTLVANAHLPYEKNLPAYQSLIEQDGFKILTCII